MCCSSDIMKCIVDLKPRPNKVASAECIMAEHLKHFHPIVADCLRIMYYVCLLCYEA